LSFTTGLNNNDQRCDLTSTCKGVKIKQIISQKGEAFKVCSHILENSSLESPKKAFKNDESPENISDGWGFQTIRYVKNMLSTNPKMILLFFISASADLF